MQRGNSDGMNTIPDLMQKLCLFFAKDDQDLAARFYKNSMLSLKGTVNVYDEDFVVDKIRKCLSSEKIHQFDSLYGQLQKNEVLQRKPNILAFFLDVSSQLNEDNPLATEVMSTTSSSSSLRSQMHFLPDDPRVGVRKLYQAPLNRKSSILSNKTHFSTTTGLSNSEQDLSTIKPSNYSSIASSRSSLLPHITETELIQEVIYSFQGIEGKVIKKEPDGVGFTIDPKYSKLLTVLQRGLVQRLTGVGVVHNQLKLHCDEAGKQIGLIGQSLIAILRDELTNYYQLVALLQAQTRRQGCVDHSDLTLRRMFVWVAEPYLHLQSLAYIAEICSDKKGGALITVVHRFLQHGATNVQKVSERVLSAVCRPLYIMLSKWLIDGELNDPLGEFFIEARSINSAERLWHDKYHIRKSMIPSFITLHQAEKILATGKSINFLRQICKDTEELPGRDTLQKLFLNSFAIFKPEQSVELQSALESVYRETSLRVLDLLKNKYRLLEHLQALRRYLLLGQGDFIRHLLELLAPELSKPANDLYGHTLSAILESAIRVTNAQYEDEDTLQRLNVTLCEISRGDTGWDVFTLLYLADGPVGTIFEPTIFIYKCLFGGLWKAKRMEFVLSNMRKQQITSNKLFKHIKEMCPVTHLLHILASEMIHFLHQTQYYFLFEVLECSWAEMLKQVDHASCLDEIIKAHSDFLQSVQRGVLLDAESGKYRLQLGLIFNLILNLESLQDTLYAAAMKEKESSDAYRKLCNKTTGFGVNKDVEFNNRERIAKFHQVLNTVKVQVQVLGSSFRENVIKYVSLLASSPDMKLQLLSTRLNFNDYYKIM